MLKLGDVQPHGRDLLKQQRRVSHQPRARHRPECLPRRASCSATRMSPVSGGGRGRWAPSLLTPFLSSSHPQAWLLPREKSPCSPSPSSHQPWQPPARAGLYLAAVPLCSGEPMAAGKEERGIG